MRFDLVIFDNDGVLVDSEWHANGILAELLTELGLPCTRERSIADYLGSTMASVRERVERVLGRALRADFEARYHERLFEIFRTTLAAVPGVAAALDHINAPTCVASGRAANRAGMTAFGFARMTPSARLREATGGAFTAMDELPALLRG